MENPEGIESLFFELASESRLAILRELNKKSWKMNDLARELDLTTTETFRQLQRLAETLLAQKQPEGTYGITNYGRLVLQLSPSLEFVFKHKEYCLTHDILRLPLQFLYRIGELSQATLEMDSVHNLNAAKRITAEAKQYMWGGGAEQPLDIGSELRELIPKGVKFKFIFPERFIPKQMPLPPEMAKSIEWRSIEGIPVNFVMNEKEAGISFCLTNGRADYAGFIGNDPAFLNWVKDLFNYYWDKARRA